MASTQSSRIIVLHLTKFGDSSLVVHCIDSAAGRCSYLLRGAGKSSSGSSGLRKGSHVSIGSFHNLAVLNIVSVSNPRSSMAYLKEYEPAMQLTSLRSDMHKNSIALFISELLYRTIVEQNCDERLFAWLCDAVARLEAAGIRDTQNSPVACSLAGTPRSESADSVILVSGNASYGSIAIGAETVGMDISAASIANFHLWFLAGFCTVMGFGPSRTGDFDGSDLLSADNLALLRQLSESVRETDDSGSIQDSSFLAAMAIPLTGRRRTEFCDQMIRYISYHLGINLHIRSLDVLHELYS